MNRFIRAALLAMLAIAATACVSNGSATGWSQPETAARTGPVEVPESMTDDYRVGSQDLLEVKVFQIEDLDRAVRVDQTGEISLPLIGKVQAAGRTVVELEDKIAELYAASYLQNPRVSVFVKEYASQRVAVTGAVVEPGIFVLTGPTSLLAAVSLAKGPNVIASYSDVALIRNEGGQRNGTFHDLDAIIAGTEPDPRVIGGDIVVVQRSGWQQTMQQLMQVAPILTFLPAL